MGKDRLLDSADNRKIIPNIVHLRKRYFYSRFIAIFVCAILLSMLLSACSLPRFLVLDDPLSPEEHLNLGVAYEKKGEPDNALREYKAASKKLPLAYLYIGNIYFRKHDYEEAEYNYKKAIKKDPNNADAHNNLAWLYCLTLEKLEYAERLALKAIELNPAKKDVYLDTLNNAREIMRTRQKTR